MILTIRYTEQHDNQVEGKVRAIIPELPMTVAYGNDEKEAQRKVLDQALIGVALLLRSHTQEPTEVFPLAFREEHSSAGY